MTDSPTGDTFTDALLVLELLRDAANGPTPDEQAVVREAHAIAQEHRGEIENLL